MLRAYKQENGYIFISSLHENVKQLSESTIWPLCFDFVSEIKIIIQPIFNHGIEWDYSWNMFIMRRPF